jgi:carbon-monoxide dehydrogenase small subunit
VTRIALKINGKPIEADVEPRTTLADFLREHLNLTGTHIGCEHGVCGACTILMDGISARSCIALAAACDGKDIRTIDGFADDPIINALRKSFSREHALQCGYCTPGMLMSAYDLVSRYSDLDETELRQEMSGNLCRCTGYQGIVKAIQNVLREKRHVS